MPSQCGRRSRQKKRDVFSKYVWSKDESEHTVQGWYIFLA